jgi:hypothetical protein
MTPVPVDHFGSAFMDPKRGDFLVIKEHTGAGMGVKIWGARAGFFRCPMSHARSLASLRDGRQIPGSLHESKAAEFLLGKVVGVTVKH